MEAHRRIIDQFGGAREIRDRNVLESALLRPQTGYYSDIIEEAAALWESLSQNHPFVDGNKRVAVTVTVAFLKVNGYTLKFEDNDAFGFLINLYDTGTFRRSELDSWLRTHTRKTSPRPD